MTGRGPRLSRDENGRVGGGTALLVWEPFYRTPHSRTDTTARPGHACLENTVTQWRSHVGSASDLFTLCVGTRARRRDGRGVASHRHFRSSTVAIDLANGTGASVSYEGRER